ncbi:MAG: DNA adenine methylase [Clostridia bacterium]|nr:DNA adenine methylase [Clostridia bacterium]
MEKIDGFTKDITKENIEKLKELFPATVKEGKIDVEELQRLLGEDVASGKEQYSFTWNGKAEAEKLSQKRTTATLIPCEKESKNWDTTKNLYIEGDNLEVLRVLQNSYNNQIKMIYIDPPYNTGNDFVYKDDFAVLSTEPTSTKRQISLINNLVKIK